MTAPNLINASSIYGKMTYTILNSTSETTLLTNSANSNKTIKITSLMFANIDGTNACDISASVYNAAVSGTGYKILHTISVPADSTFAPIGRDTPLWLEEDRRITVQASASGDISVILNYEEIS